MHATKLAVRIRPNIVLLTLTPIHGDRIGPSCMCSPTAISQASASIHLWIETLVAFTLSAAATDNMGVDICFGAVDDAVPQPGIPFVVLRADAGLVIWADGGLGGAGKQLSYDIVTQVLVTLLQM